MNIHFSYQLLFYHVVHTTQLENEWSDKSYNKEGFKKVLISWYGNKTLEEKSI